MERKLQEYLTAGVQLVWIIDPDTRTVRIRRADGSTAIAGTGHVLSADPVVPGFTCPVDALFASLPPAPPLPDELPSE